jgi:hypothetical protein
VERKRVGAKGGRQRACSMSEMSSSSAAEARKDAGRFSEPAVV